MSSHAAASKSSNNEQKIYVVEHLDPELEAWSALEYQAIAKECTAAGAIFLLSSVPPSLKVKAELEGVQIEDKSVEELFAGQQDRICLLDPAAARELSSEDGNDFDIFLFGGILGDDPPRDRTKELRQKGYQGRRLGPVQMTTDTAARVTRMIVQDKISLEKIAYIDHPELKINEHESTEMPFRYVKGADGEPIMPEGMIQLISTDSARGFEDLL